MSGDLIPGEDVPLPIAWRGEPLLEAEFIRREAKLLPVLALVRGYEIPEASKAVVITRTADLAAEDFDFAVDWLADHCASVMNPIPELRRAAAEHAKERWQRKRDADDAAHKARLAAEREAAAVPMPESMRRKFCGLRDAPEPSPDDERRKKAEALRKLATVLSDAKGESGPHNARARDGGGA